MNVRLHSLLLPLLALFFTACQKENELDKLKKSDWSPSVAAPLIDARMSLDRILAEKEGHLSTQSDGTILLQYQGELFSVKGSELIELPDLLTSTGSSPDTLRIPTSYGRLLETLILKAGRLRYAFKNPDSNELLLEIRLPFATKGGTPFQQSISVPPNEHLSGFFDLSGYEFDLSLGGTTSNSLLFEHTVIDQSSGQDLTGLAPLELQFRDLLFKYVDGYLGQYHFGIASDTIPVRIFEQWKEGELHLSDPRLELQLDNGFGFPITGELATVEAFSGDDGSGTLPLNTSNSAQDTFQLAFPGSNAIGGSIGTDFVFHQGNSNLDNLISIFPRGFRTDLALIANLSSDSSKFNFLRADSELKANMKLELPMKGRIKDVLLRDTIPMAVNVQERFDQLKKARFKLKTRNEVSVGMDIQFYFIDGGHQVIDSLFDGHNRVLKAAEPMPGGGFEAGEEEARIEYEREDGVELARTEKLILEVGMNSYNEGQDTVALKMGRELRIRFGMVAETQPGR